MLPIMQGYPQSSSSGLGASDFDNPTASVGLTAVNGVATTAMRSDAAPALDQTITPTWTGLHTFTAATTGVRLYNTRLDVDWDTAGFNHVQITISEPLDDGPGITGRKSRSVGAIASGDDLLGLIGQGHDGSAYDTGAQIFFIANQSWTGSAHGTRITFTANPDGSTTEQDVAQMMGSGEFQLPITGASAGVLIGGDFRIYRSAADMGRTPDGFTVDLGLNIGSASSAATGEARASVGFAARADGSGAGFWAGAASDVQLYRSAADVWYTPDSLQVNSYLGVGTAPDASVGVLVEHGTIAVVGRVVDAGTTNTPNGVIFRHQTSGTPAAGFGFTDFTQLDSDGAEIRSAAAVTTTWVVATDASRTARTTYSVYDSGGAREYLRGQASGTAAMIGFYGGAAAAKQTVTGSRGGNAALASLLTALSTIGLVTDSSTV